MPRGAPQTGSQTGTATRRATTRLVTGTGEIVPTPRDPAGTQASAGPATEVSEKLVW